MITIDELIKALERMESETGSLADSVLPRLRA